jgi:zinc/manganese transport system permease protein
MLAVNQLAIEFVSFPANLPSGSATILIAVLIYVLSIALGPLGGLIWLVLPRRLLEA